MDSDKGEEGGKKRVRSMIYMGRWRGLSRDVKLKSESEVEVTVEVNLISLPLVLPAGHDAATIAYTTSRVLTPCCNAALPTSSSLPLHILYSLRVFLPKCHVMCLS